MPLHAFVLEPGLLEEAAFPESLHRDALADEARIVADRLTVLQGHEALAGSIEQRAADWVRSVRARSGERSAIDAFMHEYDLSSEEGVLLMCIAEALLRIPDEETAERLIEDKIAQARWEGHLGHSDSLFVNASTWGLMLTGRIIDIDPEREQGWRSWFGQLVRRSGEPVIQLALRQAMKIMARQFVMGRGIDDALKRAREPEQDSALCSFDMLGEAALTDADAERYHQAYLQAIDALAADRPGEHDPMRRHGISIKLSALHPRYEPAQIGVLLEELLPRLSELALAAREAGIGLTLDAEEADRLEISLLLFDRLLEDRRLRGWDGLGLAVQAYQKRSMAVLEWLEDRARAHRRRIPVRLVKGAYWDTEIKLAQERGLDDYPVFTRKINSDVSWLAGARFLLDRRECFYPQLATHNAHGIAAVLAWAGDLQGFEFQRLHGMGAQLYRVVSEETGADLRCRVYAPVGSHQDLLPYLVRRLLENGANTSFVNRILDEQLPPEAVVRDPVRRVRALKRIANPAIPKPPELFLPQRRNSRGLYLADWAEQWRLARELGAIDPSMTEATPLTAAAWAEAARFAIRSPQRQSRRLGEWIEVDAASVDAAVEQAQAAQPDWDRLTVGHRAECLERAADLIEARRARFMRLCVEEAGKTLPDALAEVREAADFCRYYAAEARRSLSPQDLPGPTGEHNRLHHQGRGIFVCISPWNFPLAIFTGQVAAALVAGNSVIAKPAEQTVLTARLAAQCLIEAGIPSHVLQLLPGRGETLGSRLCADPRIAGVVFTGSTETAAAINRTLAARQGPIAVLIAETGGQNAMLVDSSALPEQVVRDVLTSAFGSSGQRCSALRVLYLQEEIADRVIQMLAGAMQRLVIGDPGLLRTDIGPVIVEAARDDLLAHIERLHREASLIHACTLPAEADAGVFVAPHAFELEDMALLEREHFGPVLHVIRYRGKDLERVIDSINATGYGLTLGVHSRIESTWRRVQARARVGNLYINRSMIGAMVGVQPFGGEGLSGTGPKAGGPHYLPRFATERTVTVNTAAIGGNARLLGSGDE